MTTEVTNGGQVLRGLAQSAWRVLPHGGSLPQDEWQRRHGAMLGALWMNVAVLGIYGLVAGGYGVIHQTGHIAGLALFALFGGSRRFGRQQRSVCVSLGLLTAAALLVHLTDGLIEAHFYFFVVIVALTLYEDWLPFLLAVAYVLVHHGVMGMLDPHEVYNRPEAWADPWKWAAIHAFFVALAGAAAVLTWRLNENIRTNLRAARQWNALILESAGEGIYRLDRNGRTVFANAAAAQMTGYTVEELTNSDDELIHHRPGEGPRHRRKDGTSFPVEYTSTPIKENGELTGAVVVFRDITEREEIDRIKGEFTSIVSHELRTPLTSIRGSLGLLAGGALGELPSGAQRMADLAVTNTDRLVRLINEILDIERIDAGHIRIEPQPANAGELVAHAAEVMRSLADDAGVELVAIAEEVRVRADTDRIIQTLTNLVSNAIKFSEPGGRVHVSCERRGDEALFRVADQGRGIPADKLEAVFNRFEQVDASDSRQKGGTGLGLAICRSIVQQHGGRIWAESTVGEGSTFCYTLPALEAPTRSNGDEGGSAGTVLVCDDDGDIVEVIRAMLGARGYHVICATSGEEALATARAEQPDVVMLDLVMPGVSGWETARALKGDPQTSGIPIVVVSVLSQKQTDAFEGRVVDWVQKPLKEACLLEALQNAMQARLSLSRVLIVEDDYDLANVLATTFARHPVQTFQAHTGREAIEASQGLHPDLLVLDLLLPESDGFQVVDSLRRHDTLRNIPIVVYTAKDLDAQERARLSLGPTKFLTKGRATPEDLDRDVMELLAGIPEDQPEPTAYAAEANPAHR